jgi:hypothetical protein
VTPPAKSNILSATIQQPQLHGLTIIPTSSPALELVHRFAYEDVGATSILQQANNRHTMKADPVKQREIWIDSPISTLTPSAKATFRWLIAPSVFLLGLMENTQGATIRFYDDNFRDNWSHQHSGTYATATTVRLNDQPIYGFGYLRTSVTGFSFQSSIPYESFHWWAEAAFTPATSGAIDSISWSVWGEAVIGAHIFRLTAQQGGNIFVFQAGEGVANRPGHQYSAATISPSSWTRVQGAEPLNFTNSTIPIVFGYTNYNKSPGLVNQPSNAPADGIFDLGLYDVKLSVTIPEPSAVLLTLFSSVLLLGHTRKRQIHPLP